MCKWWWKLEVESGMWQDLVQQKYLHGKGIYNIHNLLKVKELYLKERSIIIGDEKLTDFWGDAWCGQISFALQFPRLYDISNEIGLTVHEIAERAICWAIWKLRNKACFDKKLIRSPAEIICYACAFMKYWAGLQSANEGDQTRAGAATLQQEALRHHPRQADVDIPRIQEEADAATGDVCSHEL
ncbi:hypothetical protein BRADI_1g62059v3 [Brachypodium distachyon]|uniref:Reverse transcriptase zinc-binding domain-containing protein n=1 Tax=Brachypodium distachyon TaxID=15368 RepID=A0A2K2DSZ4_BRADI|nr:hypothetical protein BRADI_1g62059v3 [Brachypodium distachyon]